MMFYQYMPQPLRHRSHRVKQGSFLMQRTFTKSPLWKSWSSSGVRSGIEEVEWTLKDKQDPTKGSKRFMVGRGYQLATCYKLVWWAYQRIYPSCHHFESRWRFQVGGIHGRTMWYLYRHATQKHNTKVYLLNDKYH